MTLMREFTAITVTGILLSCFTAGCAVSNVKPEMVQEECSLKMYPLEKLQSGSPPVFGVSLTCLNEHGITIPWDKEFARVIWSGKIRMVMHSPNGEVNTKGLIFQTSNTYGAREEITLRKNVAVESTLDFSYQPLSRYKDFFSKAGKITFLFFLTTPKGEIKINDDTLVFSML